MRTIVVGLAAAAVLAALGCKKDKADQGAADPAADPGQQAVAPKDTATDPPPADPVLERGRYLADLTGCMFCHTGFGPHGPDMEKAWAGGLEVPEPFGTWRSPNITPDESTGIGRWTDEEIIAAIREGKRKSGEGLFPIMPYLFYNRMSDEDARALVAYMRSLPPIENAVARVTDLKLPLIPAPKPTGAAPADDPVSRGEYLASLMHCAMCHTPMGKDNMPDMSKMFAGGLHMEAPMMGDGVLYSSNITPDPDTGIGGWTDEELANAIRGMTKRDGSPILGPMALYQGGWYRIEDADLAAVIAYLRSLKPIANKVPASTFKPKGPPPPQEM
jgi:mono/diheme cytochrome c family protein